MVSSRIYLLLALIMFIVPVHSINFTGTLSGSECRAYFASEDVNKKLQALFSCPKKWLSKSKKRISHIQKRFIFVNE